MRIYALSPYRVFIFLYNCINRAEKPICHIGKSVYTLHFQKYNCVYTLYILGRKPIIICRWGCVSGGERKYILRNCEKGIAIGCSMVYNKAIKRTEDKTMTTMYIDNKAAAKHSIEIYAIDRNEYKTAEELKELAYDCMSKDVYLIRVFENDTELFTIRNEK